MRPRIPWARIFIEGVVIVASILLALAADEWAQDRSLQAEELDALVRLELELADASADLISFRARQQRVVEAGRVLLAHTGPRRDSTLSADSLGALIWTVSWAWTADPPTGVLSSLISTGGIATVENRELGAELVAWAALLEDLKVGEAAAEQIVDLTVTPFLQTQLSYRSLIAASDRDIGLGPSTFPMGVHEILSNREFENIVMNRVFWVGHVIEEYDRVIQHLDEIRADVAEELRMRQ